MSPNYREVLHNGTSVKINNNEVGCRDDTVPKTEKALRGGLRACNKGSHPNSYRGITVNSIIAKCFEKAILHRLWPVLEEKGFSHPSQSAFVKDHSSADGIFSTTEVLRTLLLEGSENHALCL